MKLLTQPDDGTGPIVSGIKAAQKTIALTIFRFDRPEIEKALQVAVERGVAVRALIAHTNAGGEKPLRKLELRMLGAGITVTRTADDLIRYHNKMMVVDGTTLYVLGFNFTRLDMEASRSFGIISKNRSLVQEAGRLFEADIARQPFVPAHDALVVSPESSRDLLTAFIKKAKKELLIYDPKVTDPAMMRLLLERVKAGVDVRILGRIGKKGVAIKVHKLPKIRLHVRALIRDGHRAFVGSQSLRKLELEGRREVGILIRDPKVVKRMATVFEQDWAATDFGKEAAKAEAKAEAKVEHPLDKNGRGVELASAKV